MKRLLCAMLLVALTGCATISTGYRGVKLEMQKPTGDVLPEGFYMFNPFMQSIIEMNVQQQTDNMEVSVLTHDGQRVDAAVSVMYQLDPGKVVEVYDRLRNDYQERVIEPTVRSAVREAVGNYKYLDLVANQGKVQSSIDRVLRQSVSSQGIIVNNVYLTKVAFDQTVQQAIENTVKAKQDLLTAQIEAQRAATEAGGAANAQKAQRLTLSPMLLQKMAIDKWDGRLPAYFVTGSQATPSLLKMIGGSTEP